MNGNPDQAKRIDSLDWLRGIMALSIMLYHYLSWTIGEPPIGTILGKLGLYAVSIFFVLSGLSLAIVYHDYIKGIKASLYFFIRRIFRIWPVLWLTAAIATMLAAYRHIPIDYYMIFLNLTTLFGFIDFGNYVSAGVWSIGNEMVYYSITPAIIIAFNKGLRYGNALLIASILAGIFFSFNAIDSKSTIASQWNTYINPFNNLFLFTSGIALYYNFKSLFIRKRTVLFGAGAVALLFALIKVSGDPILAVTGVNRVALSSLSILIVLFFWKMDIGLPEVINKPWSRICLASYSIYLFHPLVLQIIKIIAAGNLARARFIIPISVAITIILSLAIYKFVEKPFIRLGKKITPDLSVRSDKAGILSPECV
jgi:exopolysaccharide production protein ExoZ